MFLYQVITFVVPSGDIYLSVASWYVLFGSFDDCGYKLAISIVNKKTELNIMVDDIKPHIIGITESWANNDITNAELGLEGYVMFRKARIGRRGGGVLLYIKDTIPAYEVQLHEEADCNEAIWCNLVTGHTTVIIGVV